uniref:Uncharacterized protein n=1 Tax=Globodera rostochiensis TaxID=31243 RepID=A0A914H5D4_GLORO
MVGAQHGHQLLMGGLADGRLEDGHLQLVGGLADERLEDGHLQQVVERKAPPTTPISRSTFPFAYTI